MYILSTATKKKSLLSGVCGCERTFRSKLKLKQLVNSVQKYVFSGTSERNQNFAVTEDSIPVEIFKILFYDRILKIMKNDHDR
jgi:hypothetical protein